MKEFLTHIPVAPEGLPVTDIYAESAQFPGVAVDGGALRVHWQSFTSCHAILRTGILGADGLTGVENISGDGEVLYPVSLACDGGVWYAWGEAANDRWSIKARFVKAGTWSDTLVVDEDEALFYPSLFLQHGKPCLLWTRQHRGTAQAVLCPLSQNGCGTQEIVSQSKEAFRANACEGGDGNLYLTYDVYENGGYDVIARVKTASGWSAEVRADQTEDWVCAPRIVATPTGATVCWYTFGYGATFAVYSADLAVSEGALCAAPALTLTENVGWYMDLTAASNKAGLQIVAYTWSKNSVQIRYRRGAGAWSLPAQMSYGDGHCA
ncbi:MAG: hypothetical protein RRY53_02790, partial [Pseudoflavonifractor sp.]